MTWPFRTIWADIGEAETGLLVEILDTAIQLHARLHENVVVGGGDRYAQHLALNVESRIRALIAHSPHITANVRDGVSK